MLSFQDRLPRRDLLRLSAAGVLGASMSGWLETLARLDAAPAAPAAPKRNKACILLWMNGGASQGLTFDVKEGGPYRPVPTAVPDIRISEYLPKLGRQMKEMALLRGMSTGVSSHGTAHHLMGTGFPTGAMKRPAIGSVVAHELGAADSPLPSFVVVDGGHANGLGVLKPPFHPAHLGPRHAPMMIDDPARGIADLKPVVGAEEFRLRAADLVEDNREFQSRYRDNASLAHGTTVQRALSLMNSETFRALNIENEKPQVREAYGTDKFGQACLLARRLVEVGVSFVEIINDGWDDHGGAIDRIKGRTYLDNAFSALIADLKERGMLETTLVVWMSEFGRTPSLNHGGHHCKAWTTVLAGAGINGGQVIGKTDKVGDVVVENPIDAPTFMATVFRALDIDSAKKIDHNGFGLPLVDKKAQPLVQLF